MSRTVAISTLGCKTNRYESAALQEQLERAGYRIVELESGAELVIVNSCTVTSATDAQTRNIIRKARRYNPCARVVVTGCYAQVDPQALASLPGVSLVIGNEEKKDFLALLDSEEGRIHVSDIRRENSVEVPQLSGFENRSRAFVQIQTGCDAFCSYCIIPYARGRSRSVAPDQVIDQIRRLCDAGFCEVVLTGIHIGGYGVDLSPAISLVNLMDRILTQTPLQRLRLGSLEPTELPEALIELVASSDRVCPHFHIPLQSGSDSVLKRMNRHYGQGYFVERIEAILKALPEAAIGVDLITGFPAETEEEFEETQRFLENLPVAYAHVFPFSRRPGTPAATFEGQLPGDLIKARAARLRLISDRKEAAYARRFFGRTLEVIAEAGEATWRKGVSAQYLPVRFRFEGQPPRTPLRVEVDAWDGKALKGRVLLP